MATGRNFTANSTSRTTFKALLLRLMLLCSLPLLLLAIAFAIAYVVEMHARSEREAMRTVRNFASALDHNIAARISALQLLAASLLIDEPVQLATVYRQAQGFRSSFGGEVVLADTDLQMLLNTRAPFGARLGTLPKPKGYAAAPFALASGKPAVGDMFRSLDGNEWLVAVVVPIVREDKIRFLLLNVIETAVLQQRLDKLSLPSSWLIKVVDSGNNTIASRLPPGTERFAAENDGPVRFAAGVENTRWSVALEVPRAVYLQPDLVGTVTVLALIFSTLLVSAVVGRLMWSRLSQAVATLADPAAALPARHLEIDEIERIRRTLLEAQQFRLQAQAALRDSESRFRELFECNPQPMWTYDLETLAFLSVNDAAVAQYGYSRQEFLAMTIRDIRPSEDVPHLMDDLAHVREGLGGTRTWRHCRKDGSTLLVEITAHSLAHGERPSRLILAHDVTERELVQVRLRASEESLSITLQSIGDAVIATDPAGKITRMNGTAERMTGWSLTDAMGQPLTEVFRIVNATTQLPAANPVELVMTNGETVGLANHTALMARDGNTYQIADSAAPIRNGAGSIVGVVLVFSDVTEAYRIRQDLATSAELLERTGEMAKVGGWELDLQTMKPYWSRETCRIHEVDPPITPPLDATLGFYPPGARETIQAAVQAAIAHGTPWDLELPLITAKGRHMWVRTQCSAVLEGGNVTKLLGAFHDITERKRTELALRESEAFNFAILNSVASEIAVLDRDGKIIAVNEPWRRFALENSIVPGMTAPRTGVGTNYLDVCRPGDGNAVYDDAESARNGIQAVLDGRMQTFNLEYSCHAPDQQRWFNLSVTPLGNHSQGVVVAHTNITVKKQAEAARIAIINASMDAIITVDEHEKVVLFSVAAEKMFQLSALEATGQTIDRFIPARYRSRHHGHIALLRQSGSVSRPMGQFARLTALRADDTEFPIEASISQIEAGGKSLFTATIRDVTERQHAEAVRASLEAQLRESQKMEAIGTLAGGIAHDFNNMLATIIGNTDLAQQDLADNPTARESLDEIRKASKRARALVQQILSFSRRQPTELKPTALTAVVEESARLLRATLPPRLTLDVHCEIDVPAVSADATQVEQIIVNLVANAMHALRGNNGHISIQLDSVQLDGPLVEEHPSLQTMTSSRPGRAVRLRVSDDGPGMDAATLARIFEPFFTTKPVDEGTGLGLSVVHGIVETHAGVIEVSSQLGKGATFTVYFPAADVAGAADASIPPRSASAAVTAAATPDGRRHILYVDDDEALVFLIKRLLERRGIRVSGFTDQKEALEALHACPADFDLVVSDYNMPGLSGLDVAREVRSIRADLPVAVASGFIDETLREQAEAVGVCELIFKANAVEDLSDAFARLAQSASSK